jgi:hypothetical protein
MRSTGDDTPSPAALPVIGWRENIDFPDWGVDGVRAKIDTGANTSAIHVHDVEVIDDTRVAFHVSLDPKARRLSDRIEAEVVRESRIKSSTGHAQVRRVVRTDMLVGGHRYPIEASLVCRKSMTCRMLIGRRALAGRFLVDSSRDFLLSDPLELPHKTGETPPRRKRRPPTGARGASAGTKKDKRRPVRPRRDTSDEPARRPSGGSATG